MEIFLIILGIVAVVVGVAIYLQKTGKVKDTDGDLIPDVIEDKVEEVKEVAKVVKARVNRVKEEAKDVAEAVKEVVKQSKDVVTAVKGAPRKGRKPSTKKPAAKK
jgi:gas vesicle protein